MKKVMMNFFMDTLLILVLMSQVFTCILLHRFPPELADTTVLSLTQYPGYRKQRLSAWIPYCQKWNRKKMSANCRQKGMGLSVGHTGLEPVTP